MKNSLLLKQEKITQLHCNWLIADAAICPEPVWFAKGCGCTMLSLFESIDEELIDVGPWLIDIKEQAEIIQLMLSLDKYGHGALWVNSPVEKESLQKNLQQRIYPFLPNGEQSRFRWYDPRVLNYWLNMLDTSRISDFLSPFSAVYYADPNPFFFTQHLLGWQSQSNGHYLYQSIDLKESNV